MIRITRVEEVEVTWPHASRRSNELRKEPQSATRDVPHLHALTFSLQCKPQALERDVVVKSEIGSKSERHAASRMSPVRATPGTQRVRESKASWRTSRPSTST